MTRSTMWLKPTGAAAQLMDWPTLNPGSLVGSPDDAACLTDISVQDTSQSIRDPDVSAAAVINPASLDACADSAEVTVTIDNLSTTTSVSNFDAVITLPDGLTYIGGTTTIAGCTSGPGTGDPAVSLQTLTFYDLADKANDLCDSLDPDKSITLKFDVSSDCFDGGDMTVDLIYDNCCGAPSPSRQLRRPSSAGNMPDLSVTKTPLNGQVDCGASTGLGNHRYQQSCRWYRPDCAY